MVKLGQVRARALSRDAGHRVTAPFVDDESGRWGGQVDAAVDDPSFSATDSERRDQSAIERDSKNRLV